MRKLFLLITATIFSSHLSAQIGIYEIQVSPGINWVKPKKGLDGFKGEFGMTYDVGVTVVNLVHPKDGGSSSTISLHYDYSKQKLSDEWSFRRNEVYARVKPFTFNATKSAQDGNGGFLVLILSGLYADVGYTNGKLYFENTQRGLGDIDDSQNGLFWGWGYSGIHRPENSRWGMKAGYGSKKYSWKKQMATLQNIPVV